jgi:mono/diheme cytochrome c family protein
LRNAFVAASAVLWAAVFAALSAVGPSLSAAALSAQEPVARRTVARDPAFTAAQADRGKQVYETHCVSCHLPDLDGSANPTRNARGAPLTGPRFVQDFGESKVSALFNKIKRDMPNGKPGSLTDQEYLDVASFVLQRNKFPAGQTELTVDAATDLWIPGAGGAEGLTEYTYVTTEGCLEQDATRSWMLTKAAEMKKTAAPGPGAPMAAAAMSNATPGAFTFRLLDAYNYQPEPHNGHRVRVDGYLVRLGAEIRLNVQALQMVASSCVN